MVWEQMVLIGFLVFSSAATILTIGDQRKPTTPGIALVSVAITSFLIYLITRL